MQRRMDEGRRPQRAVEVERPQPRPGVVAPPDRAQNPVRPPPLPNRPVPARPGNAGAPEVDARYMNPDAHGNYGSRYPVQPREGNRNRPAQPVDNGAVDNNSLQPSPDPIDPDQSLVAGRAPAASSTTYQMGGGRQPNADPNRPRARVQPPLNRPDTIPEQYGVAGAVMACGGSGDPDDGDGGDGSRRPRPNGPDRGGRGQGGDGWAPQNPVNR